MCSRRLASLALALVCLLTLTLGVAHGQATPPAPAAEPGRGAVNGPMAPSASYAPDMPPIAHSTLDDLPGTPDGIRRARHRGARDDVPPLRG